jgi:N-acylneuraminate cytidylyltransferase
MATALALIPARAGSQRVTHKNIRPLAGHPLLAYTISAARASGIFSRIVVSTDSERIRQVALYYGAEAPFLRPAEFATSTSPDIEWLRHALGELERAGGRYDAFSILRPTSPFRQPATIQRAWQRFLSLEGIDSLRAVELVRQHPGKMWIVAEDGARMQPLLDQSHLPVAWHAGQYQALPKVYVQNSALEIAWTRVVAGTNTREGRVLAPFFTEGSEGFSVDYPSDWLLAEQLLAGGQARLPEVSQPPYPAGALRAAVEEQTS